MEVKLLQAFLQRHRRIGLDTSIFIYQLEANPNYVELTDYIFSWLKRPGNYAVTSTITLTELLVQPYRDRKVLLVDDYHALLTTYPNLEWAPVSLEIADMAARYRAEYRLRTADALQAATAAQLGATGFITNDPAFSRVASLSTLVLDRAN